MKLRSFVQHVYQQLIVISTKNLLEECLTKLEKIVQRQMKVSEIALRKGHPFCQTSYGKSTAREGTTHVSRRHY